MSKPKKRLFRGFKLIGVDKEFEISKVTQVDMQDMEAIYFDKLKDGTWRLIYTKSTIPEIKELKAIEILREGE